MPEEFVFNGRRLVCPQCRNNQFERAEGLIEHASFFGFKRSRLAENYTCGECGYVHWFLLK